MIVAGLGFRKGVAESEVLAAIKAACVQHRIDTAAIEALAVVEAKSGEPAIHAAARSINRTVLVIGQASFETAGRHTLSHSALSVEATGVPSASEAAALAALGSKARLLGPRIAAGPVTCALASDGEAP